MWDPGFNSRHPMLSLAERQELLTPSELAVYYREVGNMFAITAVGVYIGAVISLGVSRIREEALFFTLACLLLLGVLSLFAHIEYMNARVQERKIADVQVENTPS